MPPSSPPALPTIGTFFADRYLIERVLGEGGFAVVYSGRDRGTNRPVALKVLRPEQDGYPPEVVSRFEREVKIVANLNDPHTVTLYDFGRHDGLLYFVFEYVPGVDLSEHMRKHGALTENEAAYVLTQLLRSLREAHRAGLLHRDLKPENVRIYEYAGDPLKVKLLDFGIARPAAVQQGQITQPGQVIGTPHYMSPEQLLAQPLTPASDLYSLGILLIEMLIGRQAEHGPAWADQLERLRDGHQFSLPNALGLSPSMAAIIRKLSARAPERRYQTADEVLRDLNEPVSTDAPLTPPAKRDAATLPYIRSATPSSMSAEKRAPASLTKFWVFGAIVVVLLGVALGIVTHLLTRSEPPKPTVVVHRKLPTALAKPTPPPEEPTDATTVDMGVDLSHLPTTASSGCGQKELLTGISTYTVEELGKPYTVFIPENYDPLVAHPVIILFHDAGRVPEVLIKEGRFGELADRVGAVLIAPEDQMIVDGTGLFGRVWEARTTTLPVVSMLEDVQRRLCIDRGRVFAVGQAAGGYAVERFMCEVPLAGAATNAHIKLVDDPVCDPEPAVPYLAMWGRNDGFVPREGGVNCASVDKMSWEATIDRWRKYNDTRGAGAEWETEGPVACTRWDGEAPFVQCTISGGREWPGVSRPMWAMINPCGGDSARFDAASMVWDFFAAQPARQLPEPP